MCKSECLCSQFLKVIARIERHLELVNFRREADFYRKIERRRRGAEIHIMAIL